jgi:hypothetical protein
VTVNSATRTTSQELGDALDHAEATVPALHWSRSRTENKRAPRMHYYGRDWLKPRYRDHVAGYDLMWSPPAHRAVAEYWRELYRLIPRPPYNSAEDLRTCRKRFKEAREIYENKTRYRDTRQWVNEAEGRKATSLRAILDARAAMVEAFMILGEVEGHAKYWRACQAHERKVERETKRLAHGRALAQAIKQSIGAR